MQMWKLVVVVVVDKSISVRSVLDCLDVVVVVVVDDDKY